MLKNYGLLLRKTRIDLSHFTHTKNIDMYDESRFHCKAIRLILSDHTLSYNAILDGWDISYGYFIGLQVSYTRRILGRRQ